MMELNECFKSLSAQNSKVREAIARSESALFLPHTYTPIGDKYKRVAESLTQMWNPDIKPGEKEDKSIYPPTGLLCVDEGLADEFRSLNDLKNKFRAIVLEIRDKDTKGFKFQFDAAIKEDPNFKETMYRKGLSRINLINTYRNIQVIDYKIDSIRWSWQKSAKGIEAKLVKKAIEDLEEADGSSDGFSLLKQALYSLPPNEYIAEMRKKPPRMIANVLKMLADGEKEKKALACSGVIIYVSEELPKNISWKDMPPDDRTINTISERAAIEPNPIAENSFLHRYKPGRSPKKLGKAKGKSE